MEATYKIIRHFPHGTEEIKTGLSLEEAQEHCQDPETSSRTCTTGEGLMMLSKYGFWFDGYTEE
jgi:hypothetical protein